MQIYLVTKHESHKMTLRFSLPSGSTKAVLFIVRRRVAFICWTCELQRNQKTLRQWYISPRL